RRVGGGVRGGEGGAGWRGGGKRRGPEVERGAIGDGIDARGRGGGVPATGARTGSGDQTRGQPEDVRDDTGELDVRGLEDLLHPVLRKGGFKPRPWRRSRCNRGRLAVWYDSG